MKEKGDYKIVKDKKDYYYYYKDKYLYFEDYYKVFYYGDGYGIGVNMSFVYVVYMGCQRIFLYRDILYLIFFSKGYVKYFIKDYDCYSVVIFGDQLL